MDLISYTKPPKSYIVHLPPILIVLLNLFTMKGSQFGTYRQIYCEIDYTESRKTVAIADTIVYVTLSIKNVKIQHIQ